MQLVCPGTWLSDLSQERYEVREKKSSKKVFCKFFLSLVSFLMMLVFFFFFWEVVVGNPLIFFFFLMELGWCGVVIYCDFYFKGHIFL